MRMLCLNVSTTTTMAMGCWQCLPLSVVQLKGKHCRKPHCRNGVVDTFGKSHLLQRNRQTEINISIHTYCLFTSKEFDSRLYS